MPANQNKRATLCLNMIVKNEAHIIRRCLESVKPLVDYWVISDTGSTDGTQDLIREIMVDMPGELIERPWKNFGHNRQEVLEAGTGKTDYLLTIDADEWLELGDTREFRDMRFDSYFIVKQQPGRSYNVRNIVRNDGTWRWVGVLHEYLDCDEPHTYGEVETSHINALQEGARAHDPDTYRRDAAILTTALVDEPDNARYQFYLAQSWRDADEIDLAIQHYRKRIAMGGWHEEVFFSHYQIALLMEARGDAWPNTLAQYLEAHAHTPQRAEPLYRIGKHYIETEEWPLAWLFLSAAMLIPYPEAQVLFIEDGVYYYRAKFEAAVAAYWLGDHESAIKLNREVLDRHDLPEHLRELANDNLQLSLEVTDNSKEHNLHSDQAA